MNTHIQSIKEKSRWKGTVTFTSFLIGDNEEAQQLDRMLSRAEDIEPDVFQDAINRLKEICSFREQSFQNQVVAVGRACFTGRLVGETTYTGVVNYGALGSGTTAVMDTDTVLDTEVARKGTATRTRTGNSATLRFFYSKSDTDGTYEEFGTFIDGTASADSGQMFNRVLTGGWVKSDLESLTVTAQFDLNPA